MSKLPIIISSLARWDSKISSTGYNLAQVMSKERPVFFIDHPFTIKDLFIGQKFSRIKIRLLPLLFGIRIYRKVDHLPENFTAVTPPAVIPMNWLSDGPLYRMLLRFNNFLFMRTIKKIVRDHKLNDYVFMNSFTPTYARSFPESIKPKIFVYHSIDDISNSEYISKHGVRLEKEAVLNAEICLATSSQLVKKLSPVGKKIIQLSNAVDISIFLKREEELPVPEELANVTGKVIGYIGNIFIRIDYKLIERFLKENTDKTLVMIGPRRDKKFHNINFEKYPNIIFTGAKPMSELPAYLARFDAAIIPFFCNELTRSIYPLKINEYLAAGIPVITTNFSPDISDFKDWVYLADNDDQFLEYIGKAMDEDSEEKVRNRIEVAKNNTWEIRAAQFWDIVKKYQNDELD